MEEDKKAKWERNINDELADALFCVICQEVVPPNGLSCKKCVRVYCTGCIKPQIRECPTCKFTDDEGIVPWCSPTQPALQAIISLITSDPVAFARAAVALKNRDDAIKKRLTSEIYSIHNSIASSSSSFSQSIRTRMKLRPNMAIDTQPLGNSGGRIRFGCEAISQSRYSCFLNIDFLFPLNEKEKEKEKKRIIAAVWGAGGKPLTKAVEMRERVPGSYCTAWPEWVWQWKEWENDELACIVICFSL
jgi:hypothetical protein